MQNPPSVKPYTPVNKIRLVTSASLFDGHDAAINIMRRILQASGAEIIHLGHNRSVADIAQAAIQEDAQGVAITSYQGGHIEFFKYLRDTLNANGGAHIQIVGGGGGTILPFEIEELQAYGIARIYSPDDGRTMGLQGMINDVLIRCDFPCGEKTIVNVNQLSNSSHQVLANVISAVENFEVKHAGLIAQLAEKAKQVSKSETPIIGITGTGGAGKSSVVDEIILRFKCDYPNKKLGIISVDPTKRKSGGALLGDRIRMNALSGGTVFMRSLATRQSNVALSKSLAAVLNGMKVYGFDVIILESSGIGQSDTEITQYADVSVYVMTPEYGAATQLEKIDMLDYADLIVVNKFDKKGAADALRDVRKQFQRNHNLWEQPTEEMPVFGTLASQFNDGGINIFYNRLFETLDTKCGTVFRKEKMRTFSSYTNASSAITIIPAKRVRYLSEIADAIRRYNQQTLEESDKATQLFSLENTLSLLRNSDSETTILQVLENRTDEVKKSLLASSLKTLETWQVLKTAYAAETFTYQVRGKDILVPTYRTTLSGTRVPRVILPRFKNYGDIIRWCMQENIPGSFPFTSGVFPFKREGEDPTRMFAGEGNPERTNKRFHYLSKDSDAKRLSTAFDSVTLYGEDPNHRPDIYGKVGNSGVSVCCLDDVKKLYSGFDLCSPKTSVSMTINGPAAIITAFFLNAAVDQQCEKYLANHTEIITSSENKTPRPVYNDVLPPNNYGLGLKLLGKNGSDFVPAEDFEKIKSNTLQTVRGTVQADILKEDQAQNTCIFSTEFSLRLMGDMQQYFVNQRVNNFYSVSVSGYHIAEAGANPISQLAFTLSNGFTYVEYYLARGMHIDDFAPNLSFFFSNGIDAEYAVIGRVARRIWAKAMKLCYNANTRSQQLKYHIQTSGRSLHAQEIQFNDIRTTLQALYAIYDNCNSLHTNAYDEAITTPTEESVRRAMAIQLIINHELGLTKNENPMQGSFIIEELTDLVEEAVLLEFDRLTERGGVLGAMETMYQRGKIQEESMHYEMLKHTGELPIMGVNTFLSSEGSPTILPKEVIRANPSEKESQIQTCKAVQSAHADVSDKALSELQQVALDGGNIFEALMHTTRVCTLGQITHALFAVGGQYRRNM